MAEFNRPHITFCQWSIVTMCLYCIVSETFNVEYLLTYLL